MPPVALIDPATIDTTRVLYDREGIERVNPQRFEMMQLSGILALEPDQHLIVGFKDIEPDEFWVRGHMPGFPLMPGVLLCEAAAQLASFYCLTIKLVKGGGFLGFGGMEDVRFRGPVKIGDRLILVCKALRVNRRQTIFDCQGFVEGAMVFHGKIIGVAINPDESPKEDAAAKAAEV